MDKARFKKYLGKYVSNLSIIDDEKKKAIQERADRVKYYQSWTKSRILQMNEEDLYDYISKLWAMLIWGNKHYVVDKLIDEHGLAVVRNELAELVWGKQQIAQRWDRFRKNIKGMGPAMISEILCHVHPNDSMIWNRRAYIGLLFLGFKDLPRYDYQVTGKKYVALSEQTKELVKEFKKEGIEDATLLSVDYFIWEELQPIETLSKLLKEKEHIDKKSELEKQDKETSKFIHDEIRDKLANIGKWLGFETQTEKKVAEGSVVDTIWQSTIGNMGRVIYVFEVQTKGSIDSMILNLLKSLNNPAVQGVVAVSDSPQIEKVRKHAAGVSGLSDKLKYWDYEDVLRVHESLESVNESINRLGLVPQGF